MVLSRRLILFLVGAATLPSACVAQPRTNQIHGFGQNDREVWSPASVDDLSKYLNAAKVSCSGSSAEIEVVWNSESGDWAAFDEYNGTGFFFRRTIRFAQFDEAIQIVKKHSDAEPIMTFGGEGVEQYDFLLRELSIWEHEDEVPFRIPECARQIFQNH